MRLKRAHLERDQRGFELEPLLYVWSASSLERVDVVTKDREKNDQAIVADQTLSIVLIVVKMTNFDVVLGMD